MVGKGGQTGETCIDLCPVGSCWDDLLATRRAAAQYGYTPDGQSAQVCDADLVTGFGQHRAAPATAAGAAGNNRTADSGRRLGPRRKHPGAILRRVSSRRLNPAATAGTDELAPGQRSLARPRRWGPAARTAAPATGLRPTGPSTLASACWPATGQKSGPRLATGFPLQPEPSADRLKYADFHGNFSTPIQAGFNIAPGDYTTISHYVCRDCGGHDDFVEFTFWGFNSWSAGAVYAPGCLQTSKSSRPTLTRRVLRTT